MTRWQWHTVKPCGTDAAYRRHLRHGEPACPPCRKAHALAEQASKARRPARQ